MLRKQLISVTGNKTELDFKKIQALMKNENIRNVKRRCFVEGDVSAAANRVIYTCNNLKCYIEAQKVGFFFIYGVKYKAEAQINHANCCSKCGD